MTVTQSPRFYFVRRAIQPALLLAAALTLSACSRDSGAPNRTYLPPNAPAGDDHVIQYKGPAPSTAGVINFQVSLWSQLALSDRCGSCHIEGGQSPAFARRDDINLAYAAANALVDLVDPAGSRLVAKVANGHNCWTVNTAFCEEKMIEWITSWATESGAEATIAGLEEPGIFDVGPNLDFGDDSGGFAQHVYPLLSGYCADCHRADAPQTPVQPYFASADIAVAYEAAQGKMLFNVTETEAGFSVDAGQSRLVLRLREEAHNCWSDSCTNSASAMQAALETFAAGLPLREIDTSLVTSKALRFADGTAISQSGRIESNAVAIYPFKAGRGTLVNDSADAFPPALDLHLSGEVEWVSNWGLRFNGGRAQGSVASSAKLQRYISQTGEYSLEAWLVPANVTQDGPARIVGYSGNNTERNFSLAQTLYSYNFLNRSSATSINGAPMLSTLDADGILQATQQHVVASFHPLEGRKLYVNGQQVNATDPTAGVLRDWDESFALVLGNETSGDYPWRGTLRFLAIHNRALTPAQVQTNYSAGVGQKILLAFSVAEHVEGMTDAYIVFQVEQFDDYSYLFHSPYFFSFEATPVSAFEVEGIRIGVNGREAPVGQAFAGLKATVTEAVFDREGVPLSSLGAVIQAEKGVEQDQFFLSFDRIGSRSRARVEAATPLPEEPEDLPVGPEIGLRTFAEINASLAAMTGIAVTEAGVAATFEALKQQLPPMEDVAAFGVALQMGITQLAVRYCNMLAADAARRSAFYPNFTGSQFDEAGRAAVIARLLGVLLAHRPPTEPAQLSDQPPVAESQSHLNLLIDSLTSSCSASACSDSVVQSTLTAVCAAALGSAMMLIQ